MTNNIGTPFFMAPEVVGTGDHYRMGRGNGDAGRRWNHMFLKSNMDSFTKLVHVSYTKASCITKEEKQNKKKNRKKNIYIYICVVFRMGHL